MYIATGLEIYGLINVGSWLVWGPPLPPNNIWTLFKVESQQFSSQEKSKSSPK